MVLAAEVSATALDVVGAWDDLRWFVVFNGIADRWLWGFDADGWRLRHGEPANASLGILPMDDGPVATIDDARWLADALAFDHDAPIGISPAMSGVPPDATPKDSAAVPPAQPVHPLQGPWTLWYWQSLNQAYGAAAELRFNGSYVIRYDAEEEGSPNTDFSVRFRGREELVGLYAMAARQPGLLAEYLCLYRVLEAADMQNGRAFAASVLAAVTSKDFGDLRAVGDDDCYESAPNVFEIYRDRAREELRRLATEGIAAVPEYLYKIRNSLAHGKHDVLTSPHGERFVTAGRALPILKLLARIAVEP
jgi:hypothetical protein